MFARVKDLWQRAKIPEANRLSVNIAGCATGILFTVKNVFQAPLKQIFAGKLPLIVTTSLSSAFAEKLPLIATTLLSTGVVIFKVKKNLHEKSIDEKPLLNASLKLLKSPSSHTTQILDQLNIKRNQLHGLSVSETKNILVKAYDQLTHTTYLEKFAVSSFWATMQFVSHFAPEMLSVAFQNQSLYGFDCDEGLSLKNSFFGLVFLLALYNAKQNFNDEMQRYVPSVADLHCTLLHAFTAPVSDYGSMQEYEPSLVSTMP